MILRKAARSHGVDTIVLTPASRVVNVPLNSPGSAYEVSDRDTMTAVCRLDGAFFPQQNVMSRRAPARMRRKFRGNHTHDDTE